MDTLTGFQRDLLYIAAGLDHPSGQDVSDELEGYYEAEINYGRLYPNLDELVEDGFIEKGQLDRRTNYYEITETGTEALHTRREWEDQYVDL